MRVSIGRADVVSEVAERNRHTGVFFNEEGYFVVVCGLWGGRSVGLWGGL